MNDDILIVSDDQMMTEFQCYCFLVLSQCKIYFRNNPVAINNSETADSVSFWRNWGFI